MSGEISEIVLSAPDVEQPKEEWHPTLRRLIQYLRLKKFWLRGVDLQKC